MSKIEVNAIEPQCGTTLTLGASGDTVSIASGANLSGVGTVSWDTTAKTAAFTAVSGNGYFVNTTSGAITVTLPAGSAGAIVAFADYANTFDTNNLTIAPNGSDKIGGINTNAKVLTKGASTTFVYVDSTQGWKQVNDATLNTTGENFLVATGGTITTCGNCKIHTFTGPGTFCVSSISNTSQNNEVSYIVVAGGAGGGGGSTGPSGGGGGGGAGGFREYKSSLTCYTASPLDGNPGGTSVTVTATAFPITVGGGGAASPVANSKGGSGSNSVFSTVTSTGGGGGGIYLDAPSGTNNPGVPGGSGGGGAGHPSQPGGTGNTPPVSPSQGNPGGTGQSSTPTFAGAGGGGATAAGGNSSNPQGGPGGAGATTSISGSSTAYAGGGGGGSGSGGPEQPGGVGGGGSGGFPTNDPGSAGTTNTGGGGGGAGGINVLGGAGGSGIVIIRYKYQ